MLTPYKAGLILQDPRAWRYVPRLTEAEIKALESDIRPQRHFVDSLGEQPFPKPSWWRTLWHESFNGFWKQPKQLKSTTITLCVAAVAQGWCQAGSNGANLNWGQALLPETYSNGAGYDPNGTWDWQFALVNAAPYFSASVM